MAPDIFYTQNIKTLEEKVARLSRKRSILAWARFSVIGAAILYAWFLWSSGWLLLTMIIILSLIVFTRLVLTDIDNNRSIEHHERLIAINQNELKALDHD